MTTIDFMQNVWQGPAEEAAACRKCLEALGDTPEGGRLRNLLARIIRAYRRESGMPWPSWPTILDPSGNPVTGQQIAAAINWPQDQIDADLDRLVAVGLLRYDDA